MEQAATIAGVAGLVVLVNVPFGYWRAGVRKFSPAWFLAVHGAVPVVVALRIGAGLGFRWTTVPVLVAAYFTGQALGARLRRRRARSAAPPRDSE